MTGVGKAFVYELARKKLGDRADQWLTTPNPALEGAGTTPADVLDSDCMACKDIVARQLEAM